MHAPKHGRWQNSNLAFAISRNSEPWVLIVVFVQTKKTLGVGKAERHGFCTIWPNEGCARRGITWDTGTRGIRRCHENELNEWKELLITPKVQHNPGKLKKDPEDAVPFASRTVLLNH